MQKGKELAQKLLKITEERIFYRYWNPERFHNIFMGDLNPKIDIPAELGFYGVYLAMVSPLQKAVGC